MQRWLWLFVLAVNAWAVVTFIRDDQHWLAAAIGAVGLVGAWWVSPWKGGRTIRHAEVIALPQEQRAVVI
ncbi:hypothetical protein BH23ACT6_BH23ACT6_08140 [soil metagenome]